MCPDAKQSQTEAVKPDDGQKAGSPAGGIFVSSNDLPWESTSEFGALKWKTLFGGPDSPAAATVTQGICVISPGSAVRRHHHEAEESVYVISGTALVSSGYNGDYGPPKRVNAGDAYFFPSNCSHKTVNDSDTDFVCLYTFPKAALFEQVIYCYDE